MREGGQSEIPPPIQRAPVDAQAFTKAMDPLIAQAMSHGAEQNDEEAGVLFGAKKTNGGRGRAAPTARPVATETEAPVGIRAVGATAWLALVASRMEFADQAVEAAISPGLVGKFLIDFAEHRP